ncbi:MAG: EAL domain-containing protein [Thiohalophilus sp.]
MMALSATPDEEPIDLGTLGLARPGVEYQPLVSLATGEIVAYEALARFSSLSSCSLSSALVFAELHRQPALLLRTELQLKQIQLASAPADVPLFVNLDPHILQVPGPMLKKLLAWLKQHGVVVELIEHSRIYDALATATFIRRLQELDIEVALNDIGAPGSLLSLECLASVDYLKFDRSWLTRIREHEAGAELLGGLVRYARQMGKSTMLEGVETPGCLQLARQVGVDFVQGYYYQDSFIVYHGPGV